MRTPLACLLSLAAAVPVPAAATPVESQRIAALEKQVAELGLTANAARDRGQVENLFSRYMYFHNAFRDSEIVPLWVKKGTPDVRAQYSNNGVYTNWDNIMAYHAQRPNPPGKLTFHYVTTPLIEVADDGQTAKGLWVMSGSNRA